MPGKCRQDMKTFVIPCLVKAMGVNIPGKREIPAPKVTNGLERPLCIGGAIWVAVPGALLNVRKEDVVDL